VLTDDDDVNDDDYTPHNDTDNHNNELDDNISVINPKAKRHRCSICIIFNCNFLMTGYKIAVKTGQYVFGLDQFKFSILAGKKSHWKKNFVLYMNKNILNFCNFGPQYSAFNRS